MTPPAAVVVGAGPAGLMAAETLAIHGTSVTVVEHMATAGRKFLIAGRGGLNMTHSEPLDRLLARYRPPAPQLIDAITAFGPTDLVRWSEGLGQATFAGSSGRIFPTAMRATPLLRAWLIRLDELGVEFRFGHRFDGWHGDGSVLAESATGTSVVAADATVLALGGASWPRTGSNGGWVRILADAGIEVAPLRPANSGFGVGGAGWSEHFRHRFAWQPLKNVGLSFGSSSARGELMITDSGVEGGAIYAIGAEVRDAVEGAGFAEITVDLHPDISVEQWKSRLAGGRRGDSSSTRLRRAGLSPVAIGLLRETRTSAESAKTVRLRLTTVESIGRAISSAGGIAWDEVDDSMMLRKLPGVFVAGEMLDWEAPTGGYLLQGCFSTGVAAAHGALAHLERN